MTSERMDFEMRWALEMAGAGVVAYTLVNDGRGTRRVEFTGREIAQRIAELERERDMIADLAKRNMRVVERERDEALASFSQAREEAEEATREYHRERAENAKLRAALEEAGVVAANADHRGECSGPDGCVCGLEDYRAARREQSDG